MTLTNVEQHRRHGPGLWHRLGPRRLTPRMERPTDDDDAPTGLLGPEVQVVFPSLPGAPDP